MQFFIALELATPTRRMLWYLFMIELEIDDCEQKWRPRLQVKLNSQCH
jgi:hypothetical protein